MSPVLTPRTTSTTPYHSDAIELIAYNIDKAMCDINDERPKRKYLGGSSLGSPCARQIQYRYMQTKPDEDKQFPARTLRIFDMGHFIEDLIAKYLRDAGFELKTHDSKGEQFGFSVAEANPVYAAQIALYQAYMDLTENPALFTVMNKDTSEIYYELVPFDKGLAQRTSDRGVEILQATKAKEMLPRIAANSDYFHCKWCEFGKTCWS